MVVHCVASTGPFARCQAPTARHAEGSQQRPGAGYALVCYDAVLRCAVLCCAMLCYMPCQVPVFPLPKGHRRSHRT